MVVAGAVEQRQSQLRRGAGVRFVEMAGAAKLEHAALADGKVLQGRGVPVPQQVIHEQALPQSAVANADGGEVQGLHEAFQNGAAAHDDIGAFGIQPRHPAAFLQRHGAEHVDDLPKLWRRQHVVALQPPLGESSGRHVGQVFDGAGTADGKVDVVRPHLAHGMHGVALHVIHDAAVLARRHHPMGVGGKLRAQTNGAEPQRVEIAMLMLGAQDDLGAAAADVDEERLLALEVKAAGHAEIDQPRLFLARHHAHVELRSFLQPLDERSLVPGLPRRRGGHGNHVVGPIRANH